MKIDESSTVNTSNLQFTRAYETPGSEANGSSSATSRVGNTGDTGDRIDLGSQALLSKAQEADSAARSSQVEHLRALVQSGQYQFDHGALSRSIVSSAINGY
jgi:anti-sigma28 factor (negative regulator of flagellin synthesis)